MSSTIKGVSFCGEVNQKGGDHFEPAMMSDAGMRPVAMHRPRGVAAGAVVRAQPVTETSLMESGESYKYTRRLKFLYIIHYFKFKGYI